MSCAADSSGLPSLFSLSVPDSVVSRLPVVCTGGRTALLIALIRTKWRPYTFLLSPRQFTRQLSSFLGLLLLLAVPLPNVFVASRISCLFFSFFFFHSFCLLPSCCDRRRCRLFTPKCRQVAMPLPRRLSAGLHSTLFRISVLLSSDVCPRIGCRHFRRTLFSSTFLFYF